MPAIKPLVALCVAACAALCIPSATEAAELQRTAQPVMYFGGVPGKAVVDTIDFDLARPTSRAVTVANLLLWWAGWQHPADRDPVFADVDVAERGRELVDAYGLDRAAREWVPRVSLSIAERSWFSMKDRAERLGGGWQRMWDDGVGDAIHRREEWLRDQQGSLLDTLLM